MAQTSEKAQAKRALLGFARPLYTTIQANTEVTDAAKIRIGIVVPAAKPTAHPVPNVAPGLRVESVDGRLVRFTLCDPANPNHQRLPTGVNGAIVMSFVGPTPPASPSVCKFEGNMSRATGQVLFPQSVEPGTQVWLIASYFNQRKQSGPACAAVGVIVNYPASIPMAA